MKTRLQAGPNGRACPAKLPGRSRVPVPPEKRFLIRWVGVGVLVSALAALAAPKDTVGPAKRGFAGGLDGARAVNASWYYNWGPKGTSEPGIEFVPMVKGKGHVNDATLAAIKESGAKVLLGFNEPERADQGNLTVEEALDAWPKLMETGLRLGSPAPSSDQRGMDWLKRFMEGVKKRRLRVDFIAVHWYRSANVADFEKWLDQLKQAYRRPVWVTEFNAYYTREDRDRFAESAFRMLAREKNVERYAYMDCAPGKPGGLFADNARTNLSELGQAYRDR
jgi:hypothetical protein